MFTLIMPSVSNMSEANRSQTSRNAKHWVNVASAVGTHEQNHEGKARVILLYTQKGILMWLNDKIIPDKV